ncbi:phage head-tail connector protein [Salinicoccus albus]|uniref:phage head-tail connector protein n=1 Tax=Salinicoccus albus TaxID=418756 RepID=UPI0003744679|nr:phage head-tail connector protein [Salinicoccus albus]
MSIEYVHTLLGTDDERVRTIYDRTEERLLNRLRQSLSDTTEVPDELTYIVDELTIMRFNRIGSEGMESESMDGHSVTYGDDDFQSYESIIVDYINRHLEDAPKKGVVRFI